MSVTSKSKAFWRGMTLSTRLCLLASLVASGSACSESNAASTGNATTASGNGAGVCGDKDLPDCPLQNWMKATLKSYLNAKDTTRLAQSLEQLAEKAPPGFDGWKDSALTAAKAARGGDIPTVKAECKHCHDRHRNRFRAERRTTSLF
jgi:hypothetical protein